MAIRIPEEVKTTIEKWAVPLGAGGLAGLAGYTLAKENPEIYGVGIGIVVAFIVTR